MSAYVQSENPFDGCKSTYLLSEVTQPRLPCEPRPLLTSLPTHLYANSWGESAGSQAVTFQMITNGGNTEGLFRAGWMESGSALPSGDFSKLQPTFDFIVSETGCASAPDALACLREVPAEAITAAMDKTPTFLSFQVRRMVVRSHIAEVD